MKIKFEAECWREVVVNSFDCEGRSDVEIDALADRLCAEVVDHLRCNGHVVERAHGQRVGAFAIVQQATAEERGAFDVALASLLEAIATPCPK